MVAGLGYKEIVSWEFLLHSRETAVPKLSIEICFDQFGNNPRLLLEHHLGFLLEGLIIAPSLVYATA